MTNEESQTAETEENPKGVSAEMQKPGTDEDKETGEDKTAETPEKAEEAGAGEEPMTDEKEGGGEEKTAETPDEADGEDSLTEIRETKEPNKKKREKNPFKDIVREKEEGASIEITPEQQKAKERILEIRDRLMTLKWDLEHSQINPAKKELYEKLKKEYEDLERISKSNP